MEGRGQRVGGVRRGGLAGDALAKPSERVGARRPSERDPGYPVIEVLPDLRVVTQHLGENGLAEPSAPDQRCADRDRLPAFDGQQRAQDRGVLLGPLDERLGPGGDAKQRGFQPGCVTFGACLAFVASHWHSS